MRPLLPVASSLAAVPQSLARVIVNCTTPVQNFISTVIAHSAISNQLSCSKQAPCVPGSCSKGCRSGAVEQQQQWRSPSSRSLAVAWQYQHLRAYAAKSKGTAAAAPATASSKAPKPVDPYAPPDFRLKRVPNAVKGNVIDKLTAGQTALLQQLKPSSSQLRSLRQLGWPLGSKQLLSLLHDQLSEATGSNVQVVPFVLDGYFQSAMSLAGVVKEQMEGGVGLPSIEQHLLTTIANLPPAEVTFDGIKVQWKGRMRGKGGMATKRVWQWGRTSTANLSDPVDYAHEAFITRGGYVGIKVWIRYKRSVMQPQAQHSIHAAVSVPELLAQAGPVTLQSRSSSAWWNTSGPMQPRQHKTWDCFSSRHDPLTSNLTSLRRWRQAEVQQQSTVCNKAALVTAAGGSETIDTVGGA